jgi:plastocyanin
VARTPAAEAPAATTAGTDPAETDPAGSAQTGSADGGGVDLECTKATKVTIAEKTSTGTGLRYVFRPRRLTIKRGAFLAITNKSGTVHVLASSPDAGIVTSVLDLKERQVIQFPKAGTFTVKSADAARRAVLRVTVSGESGCGAPKPTLTITDGYAFKPAKISLRATENFAVVNQSDAVQTVRCTPRGNGDNSRLDQGETQLLAVDEPGRYTCASVQHPEARVILRVKGS